VSAGSQTVTAASLSGAEKWFRWVSDTGLVKLDAKLTDQGTGYQNVTAELYLKLSVDSIKRVYVDSLSSDSTLHLVAGYVSTNDTVFIRFVNTAGSCGSCTYTYPKINFTVFSTMSGCAASLACSLVRNGGFEQGNGIACGGDDIIDGVDCWYPFENSSDVYRRGCVPNTFNWNDLGTSTQNTNPVLDSHSPSPNNTIIGQYCELNPSHLLYQGYSESVQTLLNSPLTPGRTYSLSCWLYNYSGQINNSNYSNPMSYPAIVTFGTSTGLVATASPNPGIYSSYPIHPQINILTSFAIAPINTWTQYSYTFTYSGAPNSNLLVGPNLSLNDINGYVNHTDNRVLYVFLDDINIVETNTLSATTTTICAGNTGTLSASGMNTYTWMPGSIISSTLMVNPIVTTVYTVTGANSGGCTQTKTTTVTVNPPPTITAYPSSIGICPGGSVTLTALGGVSYTWTPCTASCNLNALVVHPSVNTTYTVVGSASGCTNTATADVYILNSTNSINISGFNIICQGDNAFLSASGATGYTWSPCSSGCNSATIAPSPSVTTTYTVRGINACGVLSTSTVVVTVKPTYPVDPIVLSNPVCPGYSVTILANGGSPYSYTWTPPGSVVGNSITVTPSVTTTYTACTSAPGCSNTCAVVTVTVRPVPQLTVTASSFSVCAGTSTTVSVSGATTYTWSTGVTGTSATLTPTATTVYTVTGTVENCDPVTATVTAYVYPSVTATAAPNVTACPGANSILTASGGTGTYSWSPGGATTATIVVTPTAPTVYTVTSTAGVCTLSTSILVNPITCCSVTTAVLYTTTSGTVTGGVYNLNAPFTLTGDLVLENLTIFMGTNAEIIVPNNVKFAMHTVHLLGCPQMWKGIRCTGTNAAFEFTKNCLIEDAITALDVSNVTTPYLAGHILFIELSTFNKNHTGIKVANYNTASNDYLIQFSGNVFTSRKLITPDHRLVNPALTGTFNWPTDNTANLRGFASIPNTFNPDADLQSGYEFSAATYSTANMEAPNNTTVGHQGIYLESIYSSSNHNGFRMTSNETLPYVYVNFDEYNLFDNMHYGINAVNSNLMVATAAFQNMSQYVAGVNPSVPKLKTYDGGVGINVVNTMASGLSGSQTFSVAVGPIVTGLNKTTNFFINNAYGIKTENIQYLTFGYNVFHSKRVYSSSPGPISVSPPVGLGQYGIYVKSLDYRNISIKRNFMANINNGIIFIANTRRIGNLQAQYAGTVTVQNNTLKANYGSSITAGQSMTQAIATDNLLNPASSIFVGGSPVPVSIANNTLDKVFNGITATNWNTQKVETKTNTIILVDIGDNSTNQYGIQHINNLADNIFSNTVKGFNTTKVRVHGIYAAENKSQSVWCNTTENSYYGFVFKGSQNLTSWKSNTMKTHIRAMLLDNTTIGQQGAASSPIGNAWSGTWGSGTFKLFVNGIDPGTPAGNSRLYLTSATLPSTSESDAIPTSSKRYKTTAPQSLFTTSGFSSVTCPGSASVAVGSSFPFHKENLGNIVTDAYDYGTYLAGNRKNGKLAVYRALLEDTTLVTTDSILQQFKAESDTGNIGKFFALEQLFADDDLTDAETALSGISPVDTVEQVLKKMYKIYLHTKQDTYDAGDESDLIALATGCPEQMGVGVYQARVLLNSLYDIYYHYESDCGDTNNVASRKGRSNSEELANMIVNDNFMVYPNPSDGILYFTASNMGIESYTVMVYDISGKVIFTKAYSDGEKVNSLDLNLNNGIYLIQLTDNNNGDVYKQKFIIQK
jgi:hypothetical protein